MFVDLSKKNLVLLKLRYAIYLTQRQSSSELPVIFSRCNCVTPVAARDDKGFYNFVLLANESSYSKFNIVLANIVKLADTVKRITFYL